MALHIRIVEVLEQHDDADFGAAALRRRFLRLLEGPVRHTELSVRDAAKLLRCDEDELRQQLEVLLERGRLQRRRLTAGPALVALYSLSQAPLPVLMKAQAKAGPRVVKKPKRSTASARAANSAAWRSRVERTYQMIAERGRVCADDVRAELSCAQSTAWGILTTLEHDGRVTSDFEKPAPDVAKRRYYRLATPASACPTAVPNHQEGTGS